ncbi:MAG: SCO family protein [Devosia sp.]
MAASPAIARFRLVLWTLVIVAAMAATALYVFRPTPAAIGAKPFTLESTDGSTFGNSDLKGTASLVFFGYTFCPDVCPTTMAESVEWKTELALGPDKLRTIFVTVDPGRDTKQALTDYLGSFDPKIIGLVGTPEQTEAAKASFAVFSENGKPDADGNYPVNHTANVFLMDANGKFQGTIAFGEDKASALAKIKRLVGG